MTIQDIEDQVRRQVLSQMWEPVLGLVRDKIWDRVEVKDRKKVSRYLRGKVAWQIGSRVSSIDRAPGVVRDWPRVLEHIQVQIKEVV
jgi:Ni/Co efflux regulator RcnB